MLLVKGEVCKMLLDTRKWKPKPKERGWKIKRICSPSKRRVCR